MGSAHPGHATTHADCFKFATATGRRQSRKSAGPQRVPFKEKKRPDIAQPLPDMSETTGSGEHRDSPYFGLDYYQEKYGAWLFGRAVDSDRIITNLRTTRLTLLHAESGVGKSSLLRAGVAWRMRKLARRLASGTPRYGPLRPDRLQLLEGRPCPRRPTSAIRACDQCRTWPAARSPSCRLDRLDAAIETASGRAERESVHYARPVRGILPLPLSENPPPSGSPTNSPVASNRADLRANFLIAIREDAYACLGDLFKGLDRQRLTATICASSISIVPRRSRRSGGR